MSKNHKEQTDKTDKKVVYIFTDGACSGNPGPGGWGAILRYGTNEKHLSGAEPNTTNNRMEMLAAINAIKAIKFPCKIILTTDSVYLKNGITQWIVNWKKNNWKNANNKPVKNIDLWQALENEIKDHSIEWHWVKGHSGHHENELADELARKAIEKLLEK